MGVSCAGNMQLLDLSLRTPEENLACDEALLDEAESGRGGAVLRFWESRLPFVVVGYANRVAEEVQLANCEARGVPVLRRCSGGGTVVQGAGCLSYALVLPIDSQGATRSIASANAFIMERNCQAVRNSFAASRIVPKDIAVRGHTDLVLGDMKFSGNSQRRRRHFLLFHGTFLLSFDLDSVSELLRMPSLQPDYRAGRSHREFIANLNLEVGDVKRELRRVWEANDALDVFPDHRVRELVVAQYSRVEWNRKF